MKICFGFTPLRGLLIQIEPIWSDDGVKPKYIFIYNSRLRFIQTLWSRLFLTEFSGEISLFELTKDTRQRANTPIFTIYAAKL